MMAYYLSTDKQETKAIVAHVMHQHALVAEAEFRTSHLPLQVHERGCRRQCAARFALGDAVSRLTCFTQQLRCSASQASWHNCRSNLSTAVVAVGAVDVHFMTAAKFGRHAASAASEPEVHC
jgi:hypothetical protein